MRDELKKIPGLVIGQETHIRTDNSLDANGDSITQSSLYTLSKNIKNAPNARHVLVTSDIVMIDTIKQIKDSVKNTGSNIVSVLTSHKFNADVKTSLTDGTFDLVGVPSYQIPLNLSDDFKEKIVPLNSVPTTSTLASFQEAFQHCIEDNVLSRDILQQNNHLIVLPGDLTNSETNKIERYTVAEAEKLAGHIAAKHKKGEFLLICDGPRTGKYDKNNTVYPHSHQNGTKTNPVMTAFVNELENQGLQKGIDFNDFEFKFNSPHNLYKAFMYATSQSGKKVSIDGGSVSMLGADTIALPHDVQITGIGSNSVLKSPSHHQSFIEANSFSTLIIPEDNDDKNFTLIPQRMTEKPLRNNDANLMVLNLLEKIKHDYGLSEMPSFHSQLKI